MSNAPLKILELIPPERIQRFFTLTSKNGTAGMALLDPEGRPIRIQAANTLSSNDLEGCQELITQTLKTSTPPKDLIHSAPPFRAAPLTYDGAIIGLLLVRFPKENPSGKKSADHLKQNEQLMRQIRDHLQDLLEIDYELHNLSSEIVRNYEEMALLYDLSIKLSALPDPESICRIISEEIESLIPVKNLAVFLVDSKSGNLDSVIARGHDGQQHPRIHCKASEGIIGRVAETGRPIILRDAQQDPYFLPTGYPITSLLCVPIVLGQKTLGAINASDKLDGREFTTYDRKLLLAIAAGAAVALENANLLMEVKDIFMSAVRSLVMAIDAKDPYTHFHSLRVSEVSGILSEELGLDKGEVEQIRLAALLHDVGKIGVPEHVLLKPEKLTPDEWLEMKKHPLHSVHILEQVKQFSPIVKWVRHEHEHYDGSGYPDQLKGEAIPLASRIIAVADAFDAITSDRYYRKGRSDEVALSILQEGSDSQFDPVVVRAFVSAYQKDRLKDLPS